MAADIKNYLKEKEKRQKSQDDYKKKIRKHRLKNFIFIVFQHDSPQLLPFALVSLRIRIFNHRKDHCGAADIDKHFFLQFMQPPVSLRIVLRWSGRRASWKK